ncbi:MAG: extracellular solute-binding protein [Cyclobacteriaceae bacterium]
MKYLYLICALLVVASCSSPKGEKGNSSEKEKVVNVYSQRHYESDNILLEKFTEQTGIKVNVVNAGADELINRLEMEGALSPADVFITVDAARLNRAKNKALFQKVDLSNSKNLKPQLLDTDGLWFPLTYRARVIVYDLKDVDPATITTYSDLAKPEWKDKVVIRSSGSGYNQSLLAYIIEAEGEGAAQDWVKGVVANMARDPKGGDRDQIKAIASGVGEVSVVNTYYLASLLNSSNPEEVAVGKSVGVIFPNQEKEGTHINVSGAAVTKSAPNKANAVKLLEFLTSEESQKFYAANSFEYPAHKEVPADSTVATFGEFKASGLAFARDMSLTEKAVVVFDEGGWK